MEVTIKIEIELGVNAHNLHKVEIAESVIRQAVSETLMSEPHLLQDALEDPIIENLRELLENKYESALAREAELSAKRGRDTPMEEEIDNVENHLRFWWKVNVREESEVASPKTDAGGEDKIYAD